MSSNSLKHPAKNFLELVGNTPLIRLNAVSDATGCEIYGKAEFANPGGSVKDRAAKGIIEAAEASGALKENGIIVEGTAGNTGISLTLAGKFKRVPLCYCDAGNAKSGEERCSAPVRGRFKACACRSLS